MIRLPPISTLFPYTTLFRSFLMSLISWISFSSTQTTGWAESYALSYTSNTSIIFVLNSGVTSGMHHIFFPPGFQIIAQQYFPDRSPTNCNALVVYLFCQQIQCPRHTPF